MRILARVAVGQMKLWWMVRFLAWQWRQEGGKMFVFVRWECVRCVCPILRRPLCGISWWLMTKVRVLIWLILISCSERQAICCTRERWWICGSIFQDLVREGVWFLLFCFFIWRFRQLNQPLHFPVSRDPEEDNGAMFLVMNSRSIGCVGLLSLIDRGLVETKCRFCG